MPVIIETGFFFLSSTCGFNDIKLPDLAKLCDVFYIGGTKCGAMFGEAVVIPDSTRLPHFFTSIKQHGALIAKGWLLAYSLMSYLRMSSTSISAKSQMPTPGKSMQP